MASCGRSDSGGDSRRPQRRTGVTVAACLSSRPMGSRRAWARAGGAAGPDGVDIEVEAGELVAVLGRSGSGKSTLLHLLGALDRADCGEITVGGERLTGRSERSLARIRLRYIGFVFQSFQLVAECSGEENVLLPTRLPGAPRGGRREGAGADRRAGPRPGRRPFPARALRRRAATVRHRPGARQRSCPGARRRADGKSRRDRRRTMSCDCCAR